MSASPTLARLEPIWRGTARWLLRPPRISPPTRLGILRGILSFRWLTLIWVVAVFAWEVAQRNLRELPVGEPVAHPLWGFALIGLLALLNATLTMLYRRDPNLLVTPAPVLAEIALMSTLLLTDIWVYGSPDHDQALPSVAVLSAILAVAVAAGLRASIATGFGLGLARYVGWLPLTDEPEAALSVSRVATWVLLVVAGWTVGYVLVRLELADRSIATFRAREEVARTLHDGVLQTLAVIQRRSDDADLINLARTQEFELREYLFGGDTTEADLATGLRAAARRAEDRYGLRVDVIAAPDLPTGDHRQIHALCGAAGEALTNSAKHGQATSAVIYAEPAEIDHQGDRHGDQDGGDSSPKSHRGFAQPMFVSVKDNGSGFDPATVTRGQGLDQSIRKRLEELGGRVEIDGRPGRGAEIRLWL